MLAMRCYPAAMTDEPKVSEMTEFGKALWLIVQDKGPYSRAAFAKVLGQRTGWEPSRQAISNWLKGERGAPRELVPAVVAAFDLPEEEAQRLEFLYFYGQGGTAYERWRRARETGQEAPPDEPGLTKENDAGLEATRRRKAELDEAKLGQRGASGTGDRAP